MINSIKLNNEIVVPDEQGVAELGILLREHQSLDSCQKVSKMVVMTADQWAQQIEKDQDTFYFITEGF